MNDRKGDGFRDCVSCGDRLLEGEQEYCVECKPKGEEE